MSGTWPCLDGLDLKISWLGTLLKKRWQWTPLVMGVSWLIGDSAFGAGLLSPHSSIDAIPNYAFASTAWYDKRMGTAGHLRILYAVTRPSLGVVTLRWAWMWLWGMGTHSLITLLHPGLNHLPWLTYMSSYTFSQSSLHFLAPSPH